MHNDENKYTNTTAQICTLLLLYQLYTAMRKLYDLHMKMTKLPLVQIISGGGSGFSHWGRQPHWKCQCPTQVPFGKNACENESIGSRWRGGAPWIGH